MYTFSRQKQTKSGYTLSSHFSVCWNTRTGAEDVTVDEMYEEG
jgi:hypothetical protein